MNILNFSLGKTHNDSTQKIFKFDKPASVYCGSKVVDGMGYATTSTCSLAKIFVCQTKPKQGVGNTEAKVTYPCPKTYTPYKNRCLMPNMRPSTYESAQTQCANFGGIVLPIIDAGMYDFVKAWGPKAVRSDIWVGMRRNSFERTTDMGANVHKLIQTVTEQVTLSSGGNLTDTHKAQLGISRAR